MGCCVPNFDLREVKQIVESEAIDFDTNADKTFDDLNDALGFTLENLKQSIMSLRESDFHTTLVYGPRKADVYKSIFPFVTVNEWGEEEVDNIPLYIKFTVCGEGDSSKLVLFLSYKQA